MAMHRYANAPHQAIAFLSEVAPTKPCCSSQGLVPLRNIILSQEVKIGRTAHPDPPWLRSRGKVVHPHSAEPLSSAERPILWELEPGHGRVASHKEQVNKQSLAGMATDEVPVVHSEHMRGVDAMPF
eukprot:scaffold115825_cov66-Phaeocystis_antarctica.AAC.5